MLVDQPVEDPLDGVPLLDRSIEITAQHVVDDRLELIQLRRPRRHPSGPAGLGACRRPRSRHEML
ncbi:hypothetical protein OWR29_26210 [Actinoplanes sp. Pm04-4]|uniref:Uncharacterized protein n=1 Tax=Paractinoplanes pyxinae TaxID=2997416 RepID=A0ABT4B4T7_9ACTN|nr:hypothetical protein [Actinoplanes pyxinae]MCY1141506.1 hypothetical protein [Actinoplanes pyxinae]